MTTISSIDARFAQDQVGIASRTVTASVANLVSGNKTDANVADLSVGTILATRVGTLRITVGNAGQAKSLLETAKGALDTVLSLLQQQKNLAVKSADDSLTDNERGFLNQEFQAIVSEINRISTNANFNGKTLLDGSISGSSGVTTATGLANEQYSQLEAKDTTATGTVASGSLQNTLATVGENYITFGAAAADDTVTIYIDSDLLDAASTGGSDAVQSVDVSVLNGDSAATVASKVVAAINTAVAAATDSTLDNFAQFEFTTDTNSTSGIMYIKAKEAGTHLNGYGFSFFDGGASGITATIGTTNTDIEDASQANEQLFTQGATTTAADGIFKSVAANNIADTKFNGVLDFTGVDAATASSINGIKDVSVINIETDLVANDTITFGGVTFTIVAAGAASDNLDVEVDIFATRQAQAEEIAARLNSQATLGNLAENNYIFTAVDSSGDAGGAAGDYKIVATATNFGTQPTSAFTVGGAAAGKTDIDNAANGAVTGSDSVADTVTVTIQDGSGTTVGQAFTYTIAANTTTTAYTDGEIAQAFYDEYIQASDITSAKRLFDAELDVANGRVTLTAKDAGVSINDYTINFDRTVATNFVVTLGDDGTGDTTLTDNTAFTLSSTTATLGTNKSIAPSDLTFDANLLGSLTNLKGTFTLGEGNDGATDDSNNTVQFTVDVNGTTYTSNIIQLLGASASSTISNTIAAGTNIVFQSASGPTDANGNFTNNAFALNVETDINLATVTNTATGQNSLETVVANLQTQLDSISLTQERSLELTQISASSGDHRVTAAVGTILEGISGFDSIGTNRLAHNDGDIKLISDLYGDTGTNGDVTSFTVDRLTDTISTTINGETFTAYLNSGNAPTTGGVVAFGTDLDGGTNNGTYNATTKIITLGSDEGETAKLNFFSESTTDGRVLQIDLGNVATNISQININSNEGETALADALNAVFGVSSNDSLSFQVGAAATDTIGVSIGSAKTTSIYIDDDGVAQTLSVATSEQAIAAGDVIDNAINSIVSLISDVSASITSFNSAIQNNQASIQNADAARSKLLDTDYTQESTRFAEARVRVDAATAVLTQVNARIQNLLQLLQQ